MLIPLRKVKLHIAVQLGQDEIPQLIAANNFRLDLGRSGEVWLFFETAPSLRTRRLQDAMHRHAHAWAQSPQSLASVELPGFTETLTDATNARAGDATWYLHVEMADFGAWSYRVQPTFESSGVVFTAAELLAE